MNGSNGETNGNGTNHSDSDVQWQPIDESFGTLAIHSGYKPIDTTYSSTVEPISLSTTHELDAPFKNRGYEYNRTGNPTRKILETRLAALDGGKHALCFASGMSAASTFLSLLKSGDHFVSSESIYGGTTMLIEEVKRRGLSSDVIDLTDITALKSALKPNTKLVFLETPTNPTLQVIDIAKVCQVAHSFAEDIIVVVDNTFLTPYYQKPLALGADIVHYSLTKYMNGHADVLMGSLVTSRTDLYEKLKYLQSIIGAVPSPFDCYLVLRGLKTLHIRMPAFMENGLLIAKFLESHPSVEKVLHPGLTSHPQHELTLRQSSGYSGLVSFYIKEGFGNSTKFLENLNIFQNAASLGGCESLTELPFYFTHAKLPKSLQKKLGITENLVRLSVGLESSKDLIQDLAKALNNC